jgi:endonuclease/exonuclease/phosphatase family metal-dependent hydrolase
MARMTGKSVYQQWTRQTISPQIHQRQWRELKSVQLQAEGLKRDSLLKIVSWNIDFGNPGPKVRVAALLHYLQRTFGNDPGELVVLLQEVSQLSAQQILQNQWVQENFIIVGHEAPRTFQAGIPRQARYYTMAMTPRSIRLQKSFRMPLPSEMGRDALFVDLELRSSKGRPNSAMKEVFRICTTHLESLQEGNSIRAKQLELISQNLEGAENELGVIAGLVGGDMNAIHDSDRTLHKQLGLKDAWEDQLTRYGKGDSSYSQVSGHTWGYQSKSTKFAPARLDKFLYRGCVKTTTLTNTQGFEEIIGLLGVRLTADISSQEQSRGQQTIGTEAQLQRVWVSDHYGIVMGVKIVA